MFRFVSKLALIIAYDFKNIFSGGFALLIFTPVLVSLVIMLSIPTDVLQGTQTSIPIAVVSNNDRMVNTVLFSSINSISLIDNVERPRNLESALEMLDENKVVAVIKIPDNVLDSLINNIHADIEIWSNITEPSMDAMIRSFADGVSQAITSAQSSVYVFNDVARVHYDSYEEFYEAYNSFALNTLASVLQRGRIVSIEANAYNYTVHLISILVFVTGALAALFIATNSAYQFANGIYARMRISGVSYRVYTVTKLFETIMLAICVSTPAMAWGAFFFDGEFVVFDVKKLLLCIVIVAVVFFGIANGIAVLCRNMHWTALAVFLVMLLFMFVGGAFYPLHLFGGLIQDIGSYTPVSLNTVAVIWASGGTSFPYELVCFAVGAILIPFGLGVFERGACYA
jgi:hypothetical protein